MPDSLAFRDFKDSLSIAEELLKIENQYHNPPKRDEQKPVRGLRGAVAILVVASFEQFLKSCIEEQLAKLTIHPPIPIDKLPDNMKVCHTYKTLEVAMKGPAFQEALPRKDRLVDIETACRKVMSKVVNPAAFTATGGNPGAKTVKSMLKDLGVDNIIDLIEAKFVRRWTKPVAHTFISDKWDEIVNRRHIVAHTANALSITRNQLKESIKFAKIFAELIDNEIRNKINEIVRSAKKI
jgi:hypothetical protein